MGSHQDPPAFDDLAGARVDGDRDGAAGDRAGVAPMSEQRGQPGEPGRPGEKGKPGRGREGGPGGIGGAGGKGGAGEPEGAGGVGGGGGAGGPGARGVQGPPGERGADGAQPKLRWAPAVGYVLLALMAGFLFYSNRSLVNDNRHLITEVAALTRTQAEKSYQDCVTRK